MWLYSWIQAGTLARAAALVANCSTERSSNSRVECQDSMTALSSADRGLPIDWQAPRRWQAARKAPAVYSAAVGVHDDAGDLAAAHRHRHGQRAVGQSGVVVLAEREAEYPPGGHVQDRGQVELALPGLDLGAIRKAGTVVVVGLSNEREGAPVPGFNAITVAMFQKRIQGSLYGMSSSRDAMPNLLNLYAAGRLKLDELITRRYALDDVNQAYADMRSGVNIRGAVDFIPAG